MLQVFQRLNMAKLIGIRTKEQLPNRQSIRRAYKGL
jgi:hypothetical protein